MTVSYRNNFSNHIQEHTANYAVVGSIFPVLVDSFSSGTNYGGGAGSGLLNVEHAYKDYLYCDGRILNIRDYPQLYSAIRNTYGGDTAISRSAPTDPGGMIKVFYSATLSKWYLVVNRDIGVNSDRKLPYPYGTSFRFINTTTQVPPGPGLGLLNGTGFKYNIFYTTKSPSSAELTTLASTYTVNLQYIYEIVFPDGENPNTYTQNTYTFTSSNHPSVSFQRTFTFADYPYNVGTFKLPDYRDRVVVGIGGVDGDGSATVEDALVNVVGQKGGRWFISKNQILDGGVFFSVGDVRTRGYGSIQADIFTYLTGSVDVKIGPIDDYIFNKPIEHNHIILSTQPDTLIDNEVGEINWDQYAVNYSETRANISFFEPVGGGGLALGHSHGLIREVLNDPTQATYGNVAGIGGQDPNTPANIQWDVSDPYLSTRVTYNNVSLEPHGPGSGEYLGFIKPAIAQGNRYLAFGYGATGSLGGTLRTSRSVSYTLDFTGYTKFFITAIAGNDGNGGERPNDVGESLIVQFSDGSEQIIIPSSQKYRDLTGTTGTTNDQYDAVYASWTAKEVDIPVALQNQANQTVIIKQTITNSAGEQGGGIPGGNGNAIDMFGIQSVGLRGGITTTPPPANGVYPVTGSQILRVLTITYDSANGYCLATTSEPHGYRAGKFVEISGCVPGSYNGVVEIRTEQLTSTTFTYTPLTVPNSNVAVGNAKTVRLAAGSYQTVVVTPEPKCYVVNNATVIGEKIDVFTVPGTGVTFQFDELNSAGTINMNPVPAATGNVSIIEVDLRGPGGGGAGSNSNAGDAGYSYATFTLDGQSYTIYAYGGKGGKSGSSGGAGGDGGTVLIPQGLIDNPDFTYTINNGATGSTGGSTGPGSAQGAGPADPGTNQPLSGSGGDGIAETFLTTEGGNWVTYTTNGTWTAPSLAANETSRTIEVRVAGGGGGGGNPNANSGCEGSGAIGGSGGGGGLVTATLSGNPSNLQWTLGTGGAAGFNNRDGYINGTGSESGPAAGGGGAISGGQGGTGMWGNGATGGGGGGATSLTWQGAFTLIGVGGGGGGGGSGGGYNGGGTTDGCYAGGNNRNAEVNLWDRTSAIDFTPGANGTSGSCSSGGGGGGGGGAGPTGNASGGEAGQAGVGHNGNGGGTGGARGDSAYRSDYSTASFSVAGNGGAPGSAGGNGYVEIKFTRSLLNYSQIGGGGGQGASVSFTIANRNIAMIAGIQSPGSGTGGGQTGGNGSATVRYGGSVGGGTVEGDTTNPAGVYYLCDQTGIPSGASRTGNVWISSTANGNIRDRNLTPVSPGFGTTSTNKFAMTTSGSAPTYNGLATKYIPFIGAGTREYLIGNFDFTNATRIKFSVIAGSNFNGGSAPEEDLLVYWKKSGNETVNLLGSIMAANGASTSWTEVNVTLPEGSNVRDTDIQLIIRQTRVLGQDDNDTITQDNYGISAFTIFYAASEQRVFVPSNGNTIEDVDFIERTISVGQSGIVASEGRFEMSSSTPISTSTQVVPENDIPLITRYHRVKYLIKAK